MCSEIIAKRVFNEDDQLTFSCFSADTNPMHMDALVARRTQAGAPVVHGIHAFLWALENAIKTIEDTSMVKKLIVRFNKFIYLNIELHAVLVSSNEKQIKLEIRDQSIVLATIKIKISNCSSTNGTRVFDVNDKRKSKYLNSSTPTEIDINSATNLQGKIAIPNTSNKNNLLKLPKIENVWGHEYIQSIAQLSTLVGMHCPGLHSIFSGFSIDMVDTNITHGLVYRVNNTDARFNMVNMDVIGAGFSGTVDAFFRQRPIALPTIDKLRSTIVNSEFSQINALIIGGTRGLGEATARLITAGHGNVVITYANGKTDALKLQEELNVDRDSCQILNFNVLANTHDQLESLNDNITHLFYFATPQIFRQNRVMFDCQLLNEFMQFYVHTFYEICRYMCDRTTSKKLKIFYPSTVAIDERPKGLTEYAMAKCAGEVLCNDIGNNFNTKMFVKRLPRVKTDQTATVTPYESSDTITLMYRYLKEMNIETNKRLEQPA